MKFLISFHVLLLLHSPTFKQSLQYFVLKPSNLSVSRMARDNIHTPIKSNYYISFMFLITRQAG
jgi:hypothetical protein